MTKMAVACAAFSSSPVLVRRGTAIMPPPPPNRLFAAPTKPPQRSLFPAKILLSSISFHPQGRARPYIYEYFA